MITLEKLDIKYEELKDAQAIASISNDIHNAKNKPEQENWDSYWQTMASGEHPSYFNREKATIFRYGGKWITAAADTEKKFFVALKDYYFRRFFLNVVSLVTEYGCGSGSNLAQLATIAPTMQLLGCDWSEAAVRLASEHAWAYTFDMRNPPARPALAGGGILTCGALEQLGNDYGKFLDFLIDSKPDMCLHIEPFKELYDQNNDFDKLALEYHERRGYLGNFLTDLRKRVTVLHEHRTGFGNAFNEGYMIVAWTNGGIVG